jgi:hypothetical protein
VSEAAYDIRIPAESTTRALHFLVSVEDEFGLPLSGEAVRFRIAAGANGSFMEDDVAKETQETTSAKGDVTVSWYDEPDYQPRRPINTRIVASCKAAACVIRFEVFQQVL